MAMAAEVTSASMTVTAFGRDVWSCVRGQCVPDSAEFSAEDGPGALPVLRLSLASEPRRAVGRVHRLDWRG